MPWGGVEEVGMLGLLVESICVEEVGLVGAQTEQNLLVRGCGSCAEVVQSEKDAVPKISAERAKITNFWMAGGNTIFVKKSRPAAFFRCARVRV